MIPVSAHPIKLYESLFIFWKTNMLVSKMYENFVDQIRKEEDSKDTFLSTHISFYITMEFVTFLDEYHNHFTTTPGKIDKDYEPRIRQVKDIVLPLLKKWDRQHFETFRNNFVAHPWRDRKKNYSFAIPQLSKYKIPKNRIELTLLVRTLNHIAEIIEYEFQREQEYGIKYLIANGPRDELRTSTYPSLNEEFEKLIDQVNENCKAHNKTYSLNYNPIVRFENINPNQTTDVSS